MKPDHIGPSSLIRELDQKAIKDYGIPGVMLMENAGRGAFEFLMEEFAPERVAVIAGKGNNGGDGFVIARHLLNAGVEVHTLLLARRDEYTGDARINLEILGKLGAPVHEVKDRALFEDARYELEACDLIVDAILGSGLTGEVRGMMATAIEFINHLVEDHPEIRVFSVDLPSGLNSDTGQIMGAAVAADATATFGMCKPGQFCFPGAALVGTLTLIDISLPDGLYDLAPHRLMSAARARDLLPRRPEDAHKGHVGHGLVLAGSPGKTGAAVMAAQSGLRAGAGLITLAGPASLHPIFEQKTLEVMTEPLPEVDGGLLGRPSLARALELVEGKTAVALGPGLGRGSEVTAFVREMIGACPVPLVIDADGLNAVAQDPAMLDAAKGPVVLTPHPGEMARLLGKTTAEVLADRFGAARGFARERQAVVVLKGAHSLTALPEGRVFVNPSGNPGLATGGSGDVLTGVILGLLCQGLSTAEAASLGVFLHGLAGDLAAQDLGEEGLLAGDVMERLPAAWSVLREGRDD